MAFEVLYHFQPLSVAMADSADDFEAILSTAFLSLILCLNVLSKLAIITLFPFSNRVFSMTQDLGPPGLFPDFSTQLMSVHPELLSWALLPHQGAQGCNLLPLLPHCLAHPGRWPVCKPKAICPLEKQTLIPRSLLTCVVCRTLIGNEHLKSISTQLPFGGIDSVT